MDTSSDHVTVVMASTIKGMNELSLLNLLFFCFKVFIWLFSAGPNGSSHL